MSSNSNNRSSYSRRSRNINKANSSSSAFKNSKVGKHRNNFSNVNTNRVGTNNVGNAMQDGAATSYENHDVMYDEDSEGMGEGKIFFGVVQKVFFLLMSLLPVILIGGMIILVVIIVASIADGDSSGGSGLVQNGYYDPKCTEINVTFPATANKEEYTRTFSLEEYVAGVIYGEVGGLRNEESQKALAVAARTYSLSKVGNSCSIESSTNYQVMKDLTGIDDSTAKAARKAANDTSGIVVLDGDKLYLTEYDAFCWVEKDDNFYTLSSEQNNHKIPTSWVEKELDQNYEKVYSTCRCGRDNLEKSSDAICHTGSGGYNDGGHGRGMSQYGAYYLATEQNYTFQQILSFYYGEERALSVSNVEVSSVAGINFQITENASNTLNEGLEDYLSNNGSSLDELNNYIKDKVSTAGVGKRDGVVAAAVSMISFLYDKYNLKLPYYEDGIHQIYGLDASFGTLISASDMSSSTYINNKNSFSNIGLISWAIKNGGFTFNYLNIDSFINSFSGNMCFDENETCIGQIGDIIVRESGYSDNDKHIMLIVGKDENNGVYYVAEAISSGVVITSKNMHDVGVNYKIVNMDSYYNNYNNLTSDYPN